MYPHQDLHVKRKYSVVGRLYLHIGLPKTGTTFLQKVLFPEFRGVRYLSKERVNRFLDDRKIKFLFHQSPRIWRSDAAAQELIGWLIEVANGQPTLISEECIHNGLFPPRSSRPYSDVYRGRMAGYDLCTLARHSAEVERQARKHGISEVNVVVTTRRQDTFFASNYAEMSANLQNASQADFERWIGQVLSDEHLYHRSGRAN